MSATRDSLPALESSALREMMRAVGVRSRAAAHLVRVASATQRSAGLTAMADALGSARAAVLAANAEDVAAATSRGLAPAFLDRLTLTPARFDAMTAGVRSVAALPDPVGTVTASWIGPQGLAFERVRTPIGVIGIIFESRPNVTADAGALALRAGNSVILRGGSDSVRSVAAIGEALRRGLTKAGLPEDAIQITPSADRAAVGLMLGGLDGAIDVIVPRGGKSLVARVQQEARTPVFAHLEGVCHTYVHAAADADKAIAIAVNAKMRRVSVCGATETLLIDRAAAPALLPRMAAALRAAGCVLRGDAEACAIVAMDAANEEDWRAEYLDAILAIRIVSDIEEAIAHIEAYGSSHTDAIVTEDDAAAETFLQRVDSAIVLRNASTQFADGGEFGFGGEIGIATGRLHARGPVGAEQLTIFKYIVRGDGTVRP